MIRLRTSLLMCARGVRLQGNVIGRLKKINREHLVDFRNLQRESTRESCFENDVFAVLILSSVELERGQHRRDSAPYGCIRGVSACRWYDTLA